MNMEMTLRTERVTQEMFDRLPGLLSPGQMKFRIHYRPAIVCRYGWQGFGNGSELPGGATPW